MLFDPKWEKPEVKADPFSLEALIGFIETKPANEPYCYIDGGKCLLAQYMIELGFQRVRIGPCGSYTHATADGRFPDTFWRISVGGGREREWTFGAALTRARAALASQ